MLPWNNCFDQCRFCGPVTALFAKPVFGILLFASLCMQWSTSAFAAELMAADIVVGSRQVGSQTHGGAAPFGKIYHVTTLADSGPGSLRKGLARSGARIIVFDVAGIIELASDLKIFNPWVTIAGQTAPEPGITVTGASLRIRTNEVVVQHISIRPGPSDNPLVSRSRDAITVSMCSKCKIPPSGILIENVSLSWSSDELIGLFGSPLRQITVRGSILAEALRNSGHPKGSHSAGMLIGGGILGVEITGNIFANNGFRNPGINAGAAVVVTNNYIYNPHNLAIHVNAGPNTPRKTTVAIKGNVIDSGPDTRADVATVALAKTMSLRTPNAAIYVDRNEPIAPDRRTLSNPSSASLRKIPPVVARNWRSIPSGEVRSWTLRFAGSRPAQRNSVDRRILEGIRKRNGRIIDHPDQVGGLGQVAPGYRVARIPRFPFSQSGIAGMLRVQAWLCLQHFAVGGPVNTECDYPLERLHEALLVSQRSIDRLDN